MLLSGVMCRGNTALRCLQWRKLAGGCGLADEKHYILITRPEAQGAETAAMIEEQFPGQFETTCVPSALVMQQPLQRSAQVLRRFLHQATHPHWQPLLYNPTCQMRAISFICAALSRRAILRARLR